MMKSNRPGHHLATISHDGRFWDVYLEFEEPDRHASEARGRLAFSAADDEKDTTLRTATIFLESSEDGVLRRAREFETHQLVNLLRSCLP
jgi:hypothetical protein